MAIFDDSVMELQIGSVAFLKSFIATDGAIDSTYKGKQRGKRKEKFVVLILGNHIEDDPPFNATDALESLGYFYDEKRERPGHPNYSREKKVKKTV